MIAAEIQADADPTVRSQGIDPPEAVTMTTSLADYVPSIYEAQRRVRAERPRTDEWLHAQRAAVQARAAYWEMKRAEWDVTHDAPEDNRRLFRRRSVV